MKTMLRAATVTFALLIISSYSVADVTVGITSARIYYYGWDVMTRLRLNLDDVREGATVIISINEPDRASSFYKWLNLNALQLQQEPYQEDPRLVIDISTTDGKAITLYASRFSLCSRDSQHKRPISDAFRERFRFGEEQQMKQ